MSDTFENPAPEYREDRGPRIPPTKLADLEEAAPYISIFYKQDRNSALQFVDGKFSRDVAMVFCDRIRHELLDNPNCKAFTVTGIDLNGLKYVIDWIKASVQEKKTVDFEKFDLEDPDIFFKYVNAIIAANYLGIPARDFANNMTKVMLGVARKVQMSWDLFDYFLYDPALNNCSDEVRDIATASIFYAWWNAKLTDEDTPEDMMHLSWLRDQDKNLDEALHDWCVRNQEDVEKRKAEKKAKRAEEAAAAAGDGAGAGGGVGEGWGNNGGVGEGWGHDDASAGGTGWENGNTDAAAATSGGWGNPINDQSTKVNTGWEDATPAGPRTTKAPTSTNNFNTNAAGTTANADQAWESDMGIATREGTPGIYDSASTFTADDNPSVVDNANGVGKTLLPAFNDDAGASTGGDWADEVNQHDQNTNPHANVGW